VVRTASSTPWSAGVPALPWMMALVGALIGLPMFF